MKSKAKSFSQAAPVLQLMEPRLLFSATLDVVLVDNQLADQELLAAAAADVDNYILFDSHNASAASIIAQVTSWVEQQDQKLDSLSIFSHGSEGRFTLGTDTITAGAVSQASVWGQLANVLSDQANIYVMACETGLGESGQLLLDEMASLTGADIFASDNTTGAGGDWVLEASSSGDSAELEALVLPFKTAKLASYSASLQETSYQSPAAVGATSQWVDPLAVVASDDVRSVSNTGDIQDYRDFNLGISGPGQVAVEGIQVRIETNNVFATPELTLQLSWDGGNNWTESRTVLWYAGVGDVVKTAGSSVDTWGRTWTASELSDSNFQVRVTNTSFFSNEDIKVDLLQVNVTYQHNQPPIPTAGSVAVQEDNPAVISLAATDSQPVVGFRIDALPNASEGTLTLNGSAVNALAMIAKADIDAGLLVFEPAQNWNGASRFQFSAYDGQDWSVSSAVYTVNVAPVNDVPLAFELDEQVLAVGFSPFNLDLSQFVSDVETPLSQLHFAVQGDDAIAVGIDENGVATLSAKQPGWTGTQTISISVSDSDGAAAQLQLTISVIDISAAVLTADNTNAGADIEAESVTLLESSRAGGRDEFAQQAGQVADERQQLVDAVPESAAAETIDDAGPSSEEAESISSATSEEGLDSIAAISQGLVPELEDFFAASDVVAEIIDLRFVFEVDDRLDDRQPSAEPVVSALQNLKQNFLAAYNTSPLASMTAFNVPWLAASDVYWQELDDIKAQVSRETENQEEVAQVVKGAGVMSFSLFGAWFLRAAALGSSMFAALPMWRSMDPVAVLRAAPVNDGDESEGEAVEQMFDGGRPH